MVKSFDEIEQIFFQIEEGLEVARVGFLKALDIEEDNQESVRSNENALIVIKVIEKSLRLLIPFFDKNPSLEDLFIKEFGSVREWATREIILETAFLDDFLFPAQATCSLLSENKFSKDFVESYFHAFEHFVEIRSILHLETQTELKNNFSMKLNTSNLKCQCFSCIADFRTKTREIVFKDLNESIENAEQVVKELINLNQIDSISEKISELRKKMDKDIHNVRYKLKRASLSKLEFELKGVFKEKFSYKSELAKNYLNLVRPVFVSWLKEENLRSDLIGEAEYDRFFMQLDTGLWKSLKFIRPDFKKLVQTVLALKRKDISANILIEYLGQFWLHSEARKINRKIIYHMGPTNSGKTYHAVEALCSVSKGCYLAPLRLLASELYDTMNNKGVKTTLLTGEEVINIEGSTHISSTVEMARLHEEFECCVIDEIQMMSDPQRGWAWTRALISMRAKEVHICGDHSVLDLVEQIVNLTGDTLEVKKYERKTKLLIEERPISLGQLKKSDALIVFSRRNALKYKAELENLGYRVSVVYGMLSPEVRREQARKFDQGETDIIVSTDAIAMGMNLPVQRIIFSSFSKFIDNKEYFLTPSEIKQISGRAGRFGRFPIGHVTCLTKESDGISTLKHAIGTELVQSTKAMVGPDLDIFSKVNNALKQNGLPILSLSEFLRLFNTMTFKKPFYCVDLKEMIELSEMVEQADEKTKILSAAEIFGFACAPVNLGLVEHVQYYLWILNNFVHAHPIKNEEIEINSDNIDYLETAIKCVELFQWLSRHFDNKNFEFLQAELLHNKSLAVERLNALLSDKSSKTCSSCGCSLPHNSRFNVCDNCFAQRKSFARNREAISRAKNFTKGRKEKKSR